LNLIDRQRVTRQSVKMFQRLAGSPGGCCVAAEAEMLAATADGDVKRRFNPCRS
jgi:hypothetical protein